MRPVTRLELIDHIQKAFDTGPVDRDELITAAEATNARADVIAVLRILPDRSFRNPRDLWNDLPDLPIA